jgi:hypothetical protein
MRRPLHLERLHLATAEETDYRSRDSDALDDKPARTYVDFALQ